jgi:hypothetical protein
MAIKSLLVPGVSIPQPDNSWLDGIAKSVGGFIEKKGRDKALVRLADADLGNGSMPAAPAQSQSWLSKLVGGAQPQQGSAAPMTASVGAVDRGPAQGSTFQPFIDTVKTKVTNPFGLAAVAATGRAESGWSPQNAARSWSDPSQSGQSGTAGGVMSWRAERLQNLQNYARSKGENGNGSPSTQAEFFLSEDPTLVDRLNSAQSPQEAQSLMNSAWKFAGYDQPGGETARRMALAQNYYANDFRDGQNGPVAAAPDAQPAVVPAASPAQAPRVAGNVVASLDPSAGIPMPGWAGAMRANVPARPIEAAPQVASSAGQPPAAAQPASAAIRAPVQPAQQAPAILAKGVTPVGRNTVDHGLIQQLLRDPQLNEIGLQLWQQNATGKTSDGWDFVKLDDGTLARANKQTGEVESLGNFASSKKELLSNGKGAFYDSNTGQWITPPAGLGGDDKEYFGTTVPYYDAKGTLHYRQLGKNGEGKDLDFGPGSSAAPNTRTIDTGTELVTLGPGGNEVSRVAKQNQAESFQKTTGTETAKNNVEAKAALPAIETAANQMLSSIDSLANDAYLPKMVGPANSRKWNVSGDSERVQSKIDQIGGQSFLQAYNSLRGAGQITEEEGKRATAAMGRLNIAQNEKDYREALAELRAVVQSGLDRARVKAGVATGDQTTAPAPSENKTSSGVQWSIEK